MKCPSCGLQGVKDELCVHISCNRCKENWCYCCGKKEEDCNKRPGYQGFLAHNEDWKRNQRRLVISLF